MRWRPLDADVVFEVEEKLPVIEHGEVIARVNGAPWLVVNHPELGVALFSMNSEQCERKINEAEKKKLDELFNWVQQEFIELDEVSAASETATHRENHGRRKSIRKSHGTNIKVRSSFIVAKEINSNNQPHQVSLNYIGMLSTYDLDIQDCSIVQISKNVLCCVIVNTIHVQRFFIELAIPSDGNCELIDSSRITSNKWPINCRAIQIIPFSEFASLSPSFQVNYFPLLVVQNSGQLGFISSSGKLHFVNSFSDLRWMDIRIAANRTIYLQDASTGSWKGFFVELFPCNEVFRECVFSCIRILPSEIAFQCLDFFILCDYSSHSLEEEICNAYWYYFSCLLFSIFQGTAFLAEHVLPYDVIDLQLSFQYRYQIFEILHLVCESLKLTSIHSEYSSLKLRSLIVLLSRLLNLKDYSEFYEMDGSIELNGFPKLPQNIQTTFGSLISPFSVYSWVRSLLSADEHVLIEFPSVLFKYFIGLRDSKLFHMTRICLVLSQLVSKICLKEISMFITRCISFDDPVASLAILSELSVCSRCFFMMLMFDLTREDIELLPTSINLILMDFLESCALNPVARINFEELNRISEFLSLEESVMRSKIYKLIGRQDLYQTYSLSWASFEESSKTAAFKQFFEDDQESVSGMRMDGTLSLAERDISLLLFPEDCRLFEVARLISSCRVIPLRLKNSDLSVLNDPQERLRPLIDHSVSKCIGRAIFTLNSYTASLVETISVPEFCLTARVLPRNTLIRFNVDEAPSEFLLWPNFHNGVAHALRIDFAEKTSSREDITRSWVLSSCKRIKDPYTEGGFLLGLGLKRYLRTLRKSDLYNLLAKKEDGVTIGLLLGLAADRRASKDFTISQILCVHLPALLSSESHGNISPTVQAASLVGLGLIYQGSCHRLFVEILLSEIIRRPIDSSQIATSDPSSRLLYALSAGISLGLVLIGQGDKTGIDRRVDLLDFNLVDTLIQLIVGGSYDELGCRNSLFSKINKEAEKSAEHSSTSFEGRYINTVITCPAALLALTLIFIQTNDSSVLQKLPFPSNWYNLDYFQWDHILLLTISKNLIMWDSVQPSLEWVHEQVPSFLHELVEKENFKSKDCFQHAFQVYYSIIGGAYFAIGLRYAGSQDDRAKTVLVDGIKTWIEILESFKSSKRLRVVLEACVSISCVSLSLILAGSGDLEAFKLIRAILAVREGQESEASFGSFFALHESLGYLFLGGGTMTLKSDPLSIAYILIACFPFFPNYTSDNEQHLQALRHFFVLAVESRLLETRDCHSLELLSTPVQILTKDFNGMPRSVHQTTPVLLPKLSSIERIVLPGPSIFPTYVNVAESFSCAARCITVYVKKRNFRPITLAPTFHQKMIYRVCRSAQKESLIERLLILSDFQENSLEKFTLQLSWDLSITHAYFSSGACSIPDPKISRVITSTRSQFLKLLLAEFERRLMTILNVEDISLLYRDIILVIIFIRSHHILEIHSFCFSAAYLSFWGYL